MNADPECQWPLCNLDLKRSDFCRPQCFLSPEAVGVREVAPELLALLNEAAEFYNEGRVWTPQFAEKVEAAIAKATSNVSE